MDGDENRRGAFFGPLPARGIWSALELTREQFLLILLLSLLLFTFVDGPVWRHVRDSHFWRIGISYLAIPIAVAAALQRNGKARPAAVLVATGVIALVKLVLTAIILIAIGVAQG